MAEAGSPGDRDITVGRRSSPEESAFYTNSWALVVGLNRYEDKRIPALQYAERDAEDIASLLPSLDRVPRRQHTNRPRVAHEGHADGPN